MPKLTDLARRLLPPGLTGLAGAACLGCCAIPLLLAAGVLSGTGWAVLGRWMPGLTVALAAAAGAAWWWWARSRPGHGCAEGADCACGAG
ncbi:hypothetical protein [Micromonospora sp. DT47]|uniref:hypothetical protein n=1 Tax=Micromonospora sp. DT47 TaxID=3393431 RepID=UPI003CF53F4A